MNETTQVDTAQAAPEGGVPRAPQTALLRAALTGFDPYLRKADILKQALDRLAGVGDEAVREGVARLLGQLDALEPSVTMIGQVKAGKTSLVNAMAGAPGLLPADVNPWTSVVTSLHISPRPRPEGDGAVFRFFDEAEWDRLVDKGGRVGELASRAGAEDELETVRQQVLMMREKARARLGRRFEMLLGQEHDYGYVDRELIERYVCLGEEPEDEEQDVCLASTASQGRFADITKSADIYLSRPEFPLNLCIRDTPGVNDTFMMREQITIRAIRGSRLCVVVLSAHQALSTVDMALIRLISNIRSREAVIFVNRIDELSDPAREVPEIRNSIRRTLKQLHGPEDAQILFGSAYWANNALSGDLNGMSPASIAALLNWARVELGTRTEATTPEEMIWALSGVPSLYAAIAERSCETVGQETLDKVARKALNIGNGMRATNQVIWLQRKGARQEPVDKAGVLGRLDDIERRNLTLFDDEFARLAENFNTRIDRSHRSFLDRSTAALINHLERFGERAVWKCDPAGLRMLLRSAYQIFGTRSQGAAKAVYEGAAMELGELFGRTFAGLGVQYQVEAPPVPRVPPPVFIGQTIALDLHLGWWKSWWQKRRGYKAFASNFNAMIKAETDPIVAQLKTRQIEAIRDEMRGVLQEFLSEQRTIMLRVIDQADASPDQVRRLLGVDAREERETMVENTLNTLNQCVG